MKRNIILITLLFLSLCSCNAEQTEQAAVTTTAPIPHETIAVSETVAEETEPEILDSDGIVAEEERVLSEQQRVALMWAENAVSQWRNTDLGINICGEITPEITAISPDGRVSAICGDKALCFRANDDNVLEFQGMNESYISENENMLEVAE